MENKVYLTSNQREIINAVAMKVFGGEISVAEAQNHIKNNLGFDTVHFSKDGKVAVKLDDENWDYLRYALKNNTCSSNDVNERRRYR